MATFSVVLAIVGTIVGSGFISGKEIAVFFTRFGLFSYPCIFLAFFFILGYILFNFNKRRFYFRQDKNIEILFFN